MATSALRRLSALLLLLFMLIAIGTSTTPAQAATGSSLGVVNGCGSLYVRPSLTAAFQQHTGCGTVRDAAISPDGRYIAVINVDGSLSIKDGVWGQWKSHVGPGDAKKVALGPDGMVGIVNGCGAAMIKTSIFGAWQQHTACGSVADLAISPEGRYVAVINADHSLSIKDGLWGTWQPHLGAGDANDVAFGPNGMVGAVNACHALYVKTSITGAWDQHLGCDGAKSVAISPDGQVIGAVTADGSGFAKQGLWGSWVNQTQAGDTQALFIGPGAAGSNGKAADTVQVATTILNGQATPPWKGGAVPYVWGGGHGSTAGPSTGTCVGYTGSITPCPATKTVGVDCSGFTRWVYRLAYGSDVLGSGNTNSQLQKMRRVTSPAPGDLAFFGSGPSNTTHVAVYVGDGNMIEAPYTGASIRKSKVSSHSNLVGYYHYG